MAGGNLGNEYQVKAKGDILSFPVAASTTLWRGIPICRDANGYAVVGADTANYVFLGMAEEAADNSIGANGAINIRVRRHGIFRMTKNAATAATDVGLMVYMHTAHTASVHYLVGLAGATTNDIPVGVVVRREPDTPGGTTYTNKYLMIDLALAPLALVDPSAQTHITSTQKFLNLPMGAWTEQDGTTLADFADGASTTPGWSAADESMGVRWNNHATPDPISTSIPVPPDLDSTADVVVHVLAAKIGATLGDAVTWKIEAFNNADAALYDADSDFGGTSSAMTGDASTKTCQEETLTLASADVTGSPAVLVLTLQPTDGTLGTDDVIVLGVWLEYTGKLLTT